MPATGRPRFRDPSIEEPDALADGDRSLSGRCAGVIIAPRMVCNSRRMVGADARPNWNERRRARA